jgi:thiol-disulfide isomerase/thioredoxin
MIFEANFTKKILSMKKIILLPVLLIFINSIQAQNQLKFKIHPAKKYPWAVLYQLQNVQQNYINNKQQSKDSSFVFNMTGKRKGMYMLMYDMKNFLYFIYNQENVQLDVYPEQQYKIEIKKSKENKIYLPYAGKHDKWVNELNQLEKYLANDEFNTQRKKKFNEIKQQLDKLQKEYLQKSDSLLAHKYILANNEYYPDFQGDKNKYFQLKQKHYFDNIDFNDSDLQHSNIIINKINTYVFDINPPKNPKTKHLEYLKRIETILPRINDSVYKNNVIFSLTTSFVNVDGRVSKMLIEKYIDKMPQAEKNKINLNNLIEQIGLTIGEKAPDFNFVDLQEKKHQLSAITDKKPYTLLIFWSATCPHCLHAMPKIQKLMKNRQDFNVVAIGLESEKYPWSSEHQYYPEFIHGLKLQKWDNPVVKLYHLHATPTFFILNNKREIIAEPYEVKDLEKYLNQIKP